MTMMEFLAPYIAEIVVGVLGAITTTVATVSVKNHYKKIQTKEEQARKEAEQKVAEEKKAAEEKIAAEKKLAEKQRQEYERLLKEEQTRNHRQMILDELDPVYEEMNRIKESVQARTNEFKAQIKQDEKEFETRLDDLKTYHNSDKEEFDDKIKDLALKHEENLSRIRESYKFRFIQLCKTHLKDGHITESEWEQIVAFYDLYHGLGGNGQAEDYYNKVKELEVIPDKD